MRNIYKKGPELKKTVTQGTIINNCVAEKYCCEVWGVIVTPRCDMAHSGKVTHVHYLPIVPFEEWYKIDGIPFLWSKAFEKARTKILDFCKDNKFPEVNLKEKQLRVLCDSIKEQTQKDKFKNVIDSFFQLTKTNPSDYKPNANDKENLVENLIKGDIHAFHLIEDWDGKEGDYKVVLLRDLKRLEYNVAIGMNAGIEEKTITEKWKNDLAYSATMDTIYQMVAEIVSPNIEQLMERFSYNFCRIGVEDMDANVNEVLKGIIK